MNKFQVDICSDVGLVRRNNEDHLYFTENITEGKWVENVVNEPFSSNHMAMIVADGMGGEVAGEIASEVAVQSISTYLNTYYKAELSEPELVQIMNDALLIAHQKISEYVLQSSEYYGMGTTATICIIKDEKLYISWVGDSRVYRYSEHGKLTNYTYNQKNLEILTQDHSQVWYQVLAGTMTAEEARLADYSNIITQSLGDYLKNPTPEHRVYKIFKEDIIVCCSDGLNSMLSDAEIESIIMNKKNSGNLAHELTDASKLKGGYDNISVTSCIILDGTDFFQAQENTMIKNNTSPVLLNATNTDAQLTNARGNKGLAEYLENKKQSEHSRKKSIFYFWILIIVSLLCGIIAYYNYRMINKLSSTEKSYVTSRARKSNKNQSKTGETSRASITVNSSGSDSTEGLFFDSANPKNINSKYYIKSSEKTNNRSKKDSSKSQLNKIIPVIPAIAQKKDEQGRVTSSGKTALKENSEIQSLLKIRDSLYLKVQEKYVKLGLNNKKNPKIKDWAEKKRRQNENIDNPIINQVEVEKLILIQDIKQLNTEMKQFLN